MNAHEITEKIKPHAQAIARASNGGSRIAKQVIGLHRMVVSCPSDSGAIAICDEALSEWLKEQQPNSLEQG